MFTEQRKILENLSHLRIVIQLLRSYLMWQSLSMVEFYLPKSLLRAEEFVLSEFQMNIYKSLSLSEATLFENDHKQHI